MRPLLILALMLGVLAVPAFAADAEQKPDVEATTATGEKVLLHPNGRWEYINAQKQTEA